VGGRDYEASQFNRVTQARRQAGSLFKLFVYLAALQKGYSPQSTVVDQPTQIGDWEPQNANGRFRGTMPLRTAFVQSVNTVAAQLADEVGIPAVIETARRFGITSELPNVPSLALGAAEVTLLEMTRAYAAVATGNEKIEPYAVRSIQGGSQRSLSTRPAPGSSASSLGESRATMLDLLQAVVREGTGKAARLPNVPVGGKTGTTQEYRDAWFIGFTPDLIVGVWVGNDDNAPMNKVVGDDLPAQIWYDFLTRAAPLLAKGKSPPDPVQAAGGSDQGGPAPSAPAAEIVRGVPEVLDTGTLAIRGTLVRLEGIQGERGNMARQLTRFLRRREVACAPSSMPGVQRCQIGGYNLSAIILAAGGGRATPDASEELLAAEEAGPLGPPWRLEAREVRVRSSKGRNDDQDFFARVTA
jgi:penicillin-binding protein 1A